jgi:ABC-2 type transport system permease protein
MLNFKTRTLIKRELNEKLLSKSFIFMTFVVPVLMLVFMAIPQLISLIQSDKGSRIEVLTESKDFSNKIKTGFSELDFVKDGSYSVSFAVVSRDGLKSYIQDKKPEMLSRGLNAVLFIPSKALEDKQIEYYSTDPNNRAIPERLSGPINELLTDNYFSGKNIGKEDIGFARKGVNFSSFKVSKKDELQEQGFGNFILSMFFSFLLYMSLMFSGQVTLQSVLKEKSDKIIEVLLSSVSSRELMTGKIIGSVITCIVQMIIWLLPILLLVSTSWFVLPAKMTVDITYGHLIYFLINFLLAVLLYQGLFATVGALFENLQDAQQALMPLMMLLIIPFIISMPAMKNPNSTLAVVSSLTPFATLIIMPARYALSDVPLWQLALSLLINVGTILVIFPIVGKLYNIGILHVGKKPTWNEILRWLKYN